MRKGGIIVAALLAALSVSATPFAFSNGPVRRDPPKPPRRRLRTIQTQQHMDAMQAEIAAHNEAVERKKAEKKARKAARK